MRVHYLRFMRNGGTTNHDVEADLALAVGGQLQAWVSRDYLDRVQVESITPEPSETAADAFEIRYTFPVTGDGDTVRISFSLSPDAMGSGLGTLRVGESEAVEFRQFVYP